MHKYLLTTSSGYYYRFAPSRAVAAASHRADFPDEYLSNVERVLPLWERALTVTIILMMAVAAVVILAVLYRVMFC